MGSTHQTWLGSMIWVDYELCGWVLRRYSTYDTLEKPGEMFGSLCSFWGTLRECKPPIRQAQAS